MFPPERTGRAIALALTLALVVATAGGCNAIYAVDRMQHASAARAEAAAWNARIAELEQRVARGDPAAMVVQGGELLRPASPGRMDAARAYRLFERAAALGNGDAQAILGQTLLAGRVPFQFDRGEMPWPADPARGAHLLAQAAAQGCEYRGREGEPTYRIAPMDVLARHYAAQGQQAAWWTWLARSIVACRSLAAEDWSHTALARQATPAQRVAGLSVMLLQPDSFGDEIRLAQAGMSAADIAAAGRRTAELRRLVAISEQRYPAPPRPSSP
ncbi:hypothetical protein [Pseudoduganella buxea]|uniref:Sel1 repeat family protein n=1 Tax=Pseudoduganella buxea TaxID=1949069 RepID=A0A6I3T2Q0_9BURK|nr:hypothetical protein [Pseudoduganella buxea]MTV55026.1 hypothetical protein [Pseudoduganella buxea]GGB91418.1 hypothetical protein GCM10011572_11850 [Pseudoduganella buxea]